MPIMSFLRWCPWSFEGMPLQIHRFSPIPINRFSPLQIWLSSKIAWPEIDPGAVGGTPKVMNT